MGMLNSRHQPASQVLLKPFLNELFFHYEAPCFLHICDRKISAITANLCNLNSFKLCKNVTAGVEDIRMPQHLSRASFPSHFPSVGTCHWCMAKHASHSRRNNSC